MSKGTSIFQTCVSIMNTADTTLSLNQMTLPETSACSPQESTARPSSQGARARTVFFCSAIGCRNMHTRMLGPAQARARVKSCPRLPQSDPLRTPVARRGDQPITTAGDSPVHLQAISCSTDGSQRRIDRLLSMASPHDRPQRPLGEVLAKPESTQRLKGGVLTKVR